MQPLRTRSGLLLPIACMTTWVLMILTVASGQTPAFDDHQNMMDQLGVKAIRPGPNPNAPSTPLLLNSFPNSLPSGMPSAQPTDREPRKVIDLLKPETPEGHGGVPFWEIHNRLLQMATVDIPTRSSTHREFTLLAVA